MEGLKNLPLEISGEFLHDFEISQDGPYLIEIIASAKSWWQNVRSLRAFFNDDDLFVKIDGIEFPKLNGKRGLFDAEAAWNGNDLKGLKKTNVFIINLETGKHKLDFVADQKPILHDIKISKINNKIQYIPEENGVAQDGNRRQWISFILVDSPLEELKISAIAQKRFRDRDDIKLIVDGEIQPNPDSKYFKNWYWRGSLNNGSEKTFQEELNLPKGLHYIELWADRMPVLSKAEIKLISEESNKLVAKVVLYEDIIRENQVNFRSEPVINSENILAELENGESLEIVEKVVEGDYVENLSNIWHKVRLKGKDGYILSSFVEIRGQERNNIVEKIKEKANQMALDEKLMIAIAFQESKFKPFAVSYTGVLGVFQITNDALKDVLEKTGYEVTDRFDLEQSIEAGLRYYKYIILPHFDKDDAQYLEKTLAAYNAGYNKIPGDKHKKLIYEELNVTPEKRLELEKYTKAILRNYQDKDWFKKLFLPILILFIFSTLSLILTNKPRYAHYAAAVNTFSEQNTSEKNIVELYDIKNDMNNRRPLDRSFKIKLAKKENVLVIKWKKELIDGHIEKETQLFWNDKELMGTPEGLKELFLWNSDVLIARFVGGQTIYNYFFDLRDDGKKIPFVGDGQNYDHIGSTGGSWFGEFPVFGEVFIIYYRDYESYCHDWGEVFKLFGASSGRKLIKIWEMKQTEDSCENFNG